MMRMIDVFPEQDWRIIRRMVSPGQVVHADAGDKHEWTGRGVAFLKADLQKTYNS